MIDSVAGMMNAPPIPMIPRVRMRCSGEPAIADMIEPIPKTIMPNCNAPRRPNLSPRVPAVNSKLANTSV